MKVLIVEMDMLILSTLNEDPAGATSSDQSKFKKVLFPARTDAETLIHNADIAMYQAKGGGGNGYRFYKKEMKHGSLTLAIRRLDSRSSIL